MRPSTRFMIEVYRKMDSYPNGCDISNTSGLTNKELFLYLINAGIPAHIVEGEDASFSGTVSIAESQPQLADHERRR